MTIATISTYVKAHERLVLAGIAAVLLWFAVGHVESIIAAHDNANLTQAKVVAQSQADKTAALAAQVEQQSAQYQALATKLDAQNAALVAANTQLATALAQRQKTDATLPPSELANRWTVLVPQANPTVTPSGLAVDTPGAVATVQQLEQVPVLSAQLGNERTQLESTQKLLGLSQNETTTLSSEVGSLRVQITDNAKVCDARVKVESDKVHKARRRWFVIGYVAGFLSRQYIKMATGL
jgi:regulator of replication initiation timing